jgi:hypothetical protein
MLFNIRIKSALCFGLLLALAVSSGCSESREAIQPETFAPPPSPGDEKGDTNKE